MAHANARLTQFGRLLLVQRITELGWPPGQAAEALGVSRATAYKWLAATAPKAWLGWLIAARGPAAARTRCRPARCVGC
jgi:transposase